MVRDGEESLSSNNFGLKGQLMLLCVLLVTIPVAGGGIFTYNNVKKDQFEKIELQLQQQALMITADVQNVYEIAQDKVTSDLNVAREIFYSYGGGFFLDKGEGREHWQQYRRIQSRGSVPFHG